MSDPSPKQAPTAVPAAPKVASAPQSGSSSSRCVAFSAEPNTYEAAPTTPPLGMVPARFGIDPEGDVQTQSFKGAVQAMIMEEIEGQPEFLAAEWVDMDLEVALDSGCCDHVLDVEACAPGYEVFESASSAKSRKPMGRSGNGLPRKVAQEMVLFLFFLKTHRNTATFEFQKKKTDKTHGRTQTSTNNKKNRQNTRKSTDINKKEKKGKTLGATPT